MVRFLVGDMPVALEVSKIESLVDVSDLKDGQTVVDLEQVWALKTAESPRPRQFAVLKQHGTILSLGAGVEIEEWSKGRIAAMPGWIAKYLPVGVKAACGLGDNGELILVVDAKRVSAMTT